MKTNRLLMAMTFMSVLVFGTSLFAQQEVDPTWYDPWPVANKGAAPVQHPQAAKSKLEPKIVSGLTKGNSAKVRAKQSANRRTLDLGLCYQPARSLPVSWTPAVSSRYEVEFHGTGAEASALSAAKQTVKFAPPLQL